MKNFGSHVEEIELIFKEWFRGLLYVFVAIIFVALVYSLNLQQTKTLVEELAKYVKDTPLSVTYKELFEKTLEIDLTPFIVPLRSWIFSMN